MNAQPTRRNLAPLNLGMGIAGLVAIAILAVAEINPLPRTLVVIAFVVVLFALPAMFFTRKSDEYTLSLWSSATNAAFAAIILWLVAAPGLEGMIDGLFGIENGQDFPDRGAATFSILIFFLTFNIKRLTGAF